MTDPKLVETLVHPDLVQVGPAVLSRIADRLRERLGATRVVVYGSVARGDATIHSDIDLLVIAPSADRGRRRMADARAAIRDLSRGLPISPLVLTPDEVEARQGQGDAFIREIIDTGVER